MTTCPICAARVTIRPAGNPLWGCYVLSCRDCGYCQVGSAPWVLGLQVGIPVERNPRAG